MNNPDMSQFIGVFLDEAQEVLGLLESDVLQLERGDHTPELLQSIFRAAHTLKGSSRSMGFLRVGDLTHEMENVLDELRQGHIPVTTPVVNALLDCLDALGTLVESISSQGDDSNTNGRDIPALVARLGGLLGKEQATREEEAEAEAWALQDFEKAAAQDALSCGAAVLRVRVEFDAECLMKGVRLMMVLSAVESMGSILASSVSEEAMDDESFGNAVELLVAGELTEEKVTSEIGAISEIRSVGAAVWTPAAAEAPKAAPSVEAPPPSASAPPAPSAASGAQPGAQSSAQATTIRVDVGRLDSLLNLVGELVIDRTQLTRLAGELKAQNPHDPRVTELQETAHRLARTTNELQDEVMKTRMLPVDGVFQRMPRMVRDLAQKTGKDVDFRVSGGSTEMDRSVLEVLADPLIHLLRNSVDHGIEPPEERAAAGKPAQGIVTLDARHERGGIAVEITDDGRGMNPAKLKESAVRKGLLTEAAAAAMGDRDALNLIFAPGFSTAAVLSDISGRGVGMDIVRSNLERIGGRIEIESVVGRGSKFVIRLPLTLAIVRALLVCANDSTHVIPLSSVVETLKLDKGGFTRSTIGGKAVIDLRGKTVPLAELGRLLEGDPTATSPESIPLNAHAVVVGVGDRQIGLCVERFGGEQEVVIKSLGKLLGDVPGLSGAAILGDGQVALVVDAARSLQAFTDRSGDGADDVSRLVAA